MVSLPTFFILPIYSLSLEKGEGMKLPATIYWDLRWSWAVITAELPWEDYQCLSHFSNAWSVSEVASLRVCETVIKDITFSHCLRSKMPCQSQIQVRHPLSLWLAVPEMKLASKLNLNSNSDYYEWMVQISNTLNVWAQNTQMKKFTQRKLRR